MSVSLAHQVREHVLPHVSQPGQYIGREINQLVRDGDWQKAHVRVAIAFPDTYTIGMSHLGCQILYWLCNHTPGVCAERVFAPWIDAQAIMRQRRIPLFTWDTRQRVGDADLFAVSLQYELGFTNLLSMLELADIPLRASERDDSHPLVIAGGPQVDNPEPVADFLDLVVIGDGEDSLSAILKRYAELKSEGVGRRDLVPIMARAFPWIYAPALHREEYDEDGKIESVVPKIEGLPSQIERCGTADFENAAFPMRPIVPFVEVVHDRMVVEVMRGCPQRCRFCHASYTKRPIKVRSVEKTLEIAEQQHRSTGHIELGLLSLSTADHPRLRELSERINDQFEGRGVNISMPSLRVDKMLKDIPWMANSVRKSGLTIAVEAARDQLRAAIRKKVTDGDLFDGVLAAYKAGWHRVKCYFMVGFPGETEDDIRGIYDIAVEMSQLRRQIGKGPANINASIGWLVPKPFTPFQWAAQPRVEYFEQAREVLMEMSRTKRRRAVRVRTHSPERSILEAVLSRGDRRLSAVIEAAYRHGAVFDGWDEQFRWEFWQRAFDETGVDPDWYAHRERGYDEVLPWDHIRSGPRRESLQGQYDDVFAQTGQDPPRPGIIP